MSSSVASLVVVVVIVAARPGGVAPPLLRSRLELPTLAALDHLAASAKVTTSADIADDRTSRGGAGTHRRLVASWRLMPLPAAVWTPIRSTGFDLSLRRSFLDGFLSLDGRRWHDVSVSEGLEEGQSRLLVDVRKHPLWHLAARLAHNVGDPGKGAAGQ
jgi:hypothetical protein